MDSSGTVDGETLKGMNIWAIYRSTGQEPLSSNTSPDVLEAVMGSAKNERGVALDARRTRVLGWLTTRAQETDQNDEGQKEREDVHDATKQTEISGVTYSKLIGCNPIMRLKQPLGQKGGAERKIQSRLCQPFQILYRARRESSSGSYE